MWNADWDATMVRKLAGIIEYILFSGAMNLKILMKDLKYALLPKE